MALLKENSRVTRRSVIPENDGSRTRKRRRLFLVWFGESISMSSKTIVSRLGNSHLVKVRRAFNALSFISPMLFLPPFDMFTQDQCVRWHTMGTVLAHAYFHVHIRRAVYPRLTSKTLMKEKACVESGLGPTSGSLCRLILAIFSHHSCSVVSATSKTCAH